jgi:hypothetical protein
MRRNLTLGDLGAIGHGTGDDPAKDPEGEKYDPARFERLKARYDGDMGKIALGLHEDLWRARRRAKAAEERAVPAGAVVLTAEQGKAWDAYQKLGAPADLAASLEGAKTATAELAKLARAQKLRDAAEAHGFRPSVLERLANIDGIDIEIEEVEADGGKRRQARVKDGAKNPTLAEYASEKWIEFEASLKADAKGNGSANPAKPAGTKMIEQGSGGKAPKADPVEAFIEAQRKRAESRQNPLIPNTNK